MVDDGEERVRVATDVAWTEAGDRVIALALNSVHMQPVSLEGTAAVVWKVIAEGDSETCAQVVKKLADVFDADAAVIESDLRDVIADLQGRGLLAA